MLSSIDQIQALIPQKPPFVMIDELIYSDEINTRTTLKIREDNIFVKNGFLTEPALVENIAQTAAARAGHISTLEQKPVAVGYIGSIKNLEVFDLPKINEVIETEITLTNQIFDISVITGKITCNNKVIAQCEMKIFTNQSKK